MVRLAEVLAWQVPRLWSMRRGQSDIYLQRSFYIITEIGGEQAKRQGDSSPLVNSLVPGRVKLGFLSSCCFGTLLCADVQNFRD